MQRSPDNRFIVRISEHFQSLLAAEGVHYFTMFNLDLQFRTFGNSVPEEGNQIKDQA